MCVFAVLLALAVLACCRQPALATEADASQSPGYNATSLQERDIRVVAVLFSVGQTEEARKQFRGVPNIDLLKINGEPMIMHVYNALRQSRYVHKIIVVAAPEVKAALPLDEDPRTSFVVDRGDAAENVEFSLARIAKGDLIMFIPSDLVLVTTRGLDSLMERVMEEKDVDLFFPIVSREVCERAYPDEKRTYAHFQEGQFTGAHVEFLRPDRFFDRVDKIRAGKDNLYDIYYMRKNTLGMARFLGLRLTLRYLFGSLSAHDVERHLFERYRVTAKALYWNDPDLSTDLSEPDDIQMIQQVLRRREIVRQ